MSGDYEISEAPIDKAMRDVYDKVMTNFIRDTYDQFVESAKKTDFNHAIAVSRWFDDNVPDLSALMTGTTQRSLKDILKVAVFQGYSMREFVSEVTSSFAISEKRAELIGRTEIIRASNAGSLEGAKLTNIPMRKYWLSTRDNRTRGVNNKDLFDHYNVDENKGYLLDDLFTISGEKLEYPCDRGNGASAGNTINCRCTITYEVIEDTVEDFNLVEESETQVADYSKKGKKERQYHETCGWGNDTQLERLALNTKSLDKVTNRGKPVCYVSYTRGFNHPREIKMNGYKGFSKSSKASWNHEFAHSVDFQFEDVFRNAQM